MIHQTKDKQKGINIALIIYLLSLLALSPALVFAQQSDPDQPLNLARVDPNAILHRENVNHEIKAEALHESINSPYIELKPVISPNGKRLYFSRHLHPGNTLQQDDQEDIWYSDFDTQSESWKDPVLLYGHLNNEGPNFINNVSMTGDTIILGNQYLKKGKMRAGLSYSVNQQGHWSFPTPIHIKNDYNFSDQGHAFVAIKSGVIILAIERLGTKGDRDLYVAFWDGKHATEPINMGGVINSQLEESSPHLDSDNKTLYFASKGHNGYGGHDIFVSRRLDETWTKWTIPENLGPAVNGSLDDQFFSISHCGKHAVFAKQVSIHNVDLFTIDIKDLFLNLETLKKAQFR